MQIGVDFSGSFSAGSMFESSAVAAAIVPERARREIDEWTQTRWEQWGREEKPELHGQLLTPDQRLEVCEMLAAREDVRAAVVVTNSELLRSPEHVAQHRRLQLANAKQAEERAQTPEGRARGARAAKLLSGERVAGTRLSGGSYVTAAMLPMAIMAAVQRAFCFFATDTWRAEMTGFELLFDEDAKALTRYAEASLLPVLSDPRFRLVGPVAWRDSQPPHPMLTATMHADGDGFDLLKLLGLIDWVQSDASRAVQVADFCAWVVSRTIARPDDQIAARCYALLMPMLAGNGGECFERFSIGPARLTDERRYQHLPRASEPVGWLRPLPR